MRIRLHKNGSCVIYDKHSGWYHVTMRGPTGDLRAKVRCDRYADAMVSYRDFNKIAKNL